MVGLAREAEEEVRDRRQPCPLTSHSKSAAAHQMIAEEDKQMADNSKRTLLSEEDIVDSAAREFARQLEPSLNSVVQRLDMLETKVSSTSGYGTQGPSSASNANQHRLKQQTDRQYASSPRAPRRCFGCGNVGHLVRDCPNPKQQSSTCYRCGEGGHFSRDCPQNKDDSKQTSSASGKSNNKARKSDRSQTKNVRTERDPPARYHRRRLQRRKWYHASNGDDRMTPSDVDTTDQTLRMMQTDIRRRVVGPAYEEAIVVDGHDARCLMDTGSQVTTLSKWFYDKHFSDRPLEASADDLRILGAGNQAVPVLGILEVQVRLPSAIYGVEQTMDALVIVVPDTEYGDRIPITLGTNVLEPCMRAAAVIRKSNHNKVDKMSVQGRRAYDRIQSRYRFAGKDGHVGSARALLKRPVTIRPESSVIVTGKLSGATANDEYIVSVEPALSPSCAATASPVVTAMRCQVDQSTVPVRLYNGNNHNITIRPGSVIAEINAVTTVESVPMSRLDATVNSIQADTNSDSCDDIKGTTIKGVKFDLDPALLSKERLGVARDLFRRNLGTFSTGDTDLGKCDLVKHRIRLTDDIPTRERHRRLPPAKYAELRRLIQDMMDCGVIRESNSPYAAPIVLVGKRDGTTRLCIDYRRLNSKTIRDAYALPRIEESMECLKGADWFSTVDLKSSYWQLLMHEDDIEKTAFVTPLGITSVSVYPWGCVTALAAFSVQWRSALETWLTARV
ncbi:uncharacterized protein [Ptychodera flava]|uniref:uncharacterized protein n=1 Tax=Ptychodera flava TaxID=63121 RepID=UPI00396A97A4